uniref:Uncharacterized protein n=1 Tax=Arundo donax TaxID=35708 RepID=A0A0A9E3G2_ARUDO
MIMIPVRFCKKHLSLPISKELPSLSFVLCSGFPRKEAAEMWHGRRIPIVEYGKINF